MFAWLLYIASLVPPAPPVTGTPEWIDLHCHTYSARPATDYSAREDAAGNIVIRQNTSLIFRNLYMCDNKHMYKVNGNQVEDWGAYRR